MQATQGVLFSFDWSFPAAFLWGLFVVASLVGWGWLIGRWLIADRDRNDVGWALAAAWGMAVFLVLSGFLLMVSAFSANFVASFLLVGLGLWAWSIRSHKEMGKLWIDPPTLALKMFCALFLLLAFVTYAGAVANHLYSACDDFAAYFALTKMALNTGTLSDPFNYRMLGALGGQPILTALVVPFLPWKYAHLLDMGFCMLIMLGLAMEMIQGGDFRAWGMRLLVGSLALMFPIPRDNSASEITGVVLFLALLRTFDLIGERRWIGWRPTLLLAALVAAASTLRCHNVFVLVALCAAFYGCRIMNDGKNDRDVFREAFLMAAFCVVMLSPWWMVTYRSSQAFLYPLFKGTHRPEFEAYSSHLSLLQTANFVLNFLGSTGYILLFSPLLFLQAGRERRNLLCLAMAILAISMLAASQLTSYPYYDIYRYLAPIGLAYALFTTGILAKRMQEEPSWKIPGQHYKHALILLIILNLAFMPKFIAATEDNIDQIGLAIDARHHMLDYFTDFDEADEAQREYQEAFALIPKNKKTLIALDYPFLLDYQGRAIYSIDTAGAASPSPGLPYFQGAEPVKNYLKAQGIFYIAHVPFNQAGFMHSRQGEIIKLTPKFIPLYNYYATFELNFYDNIDKLAQSNRVIYASPTIQVIALDN